MSPTAYFPYVLPKSNWDLPSASDAAVLLAGIMPGDLVIADYHLEGNVTGLDVLTDTGTALAQEPALAGLAGVPEKLASMAAEFEAHIEERAAAP